MGNYKLVPSEVLKLHNAGLHAAEIARRFDVTRTCIAHFLKARGLPANVYKHIYGECIIYKGEKYFRTKTGYYQSSKGKYMHRVIWEEQNGKLAPGERLIVPDKNDPFNVRRR